MNNGLQIMEMRANGSAKRRENERVAEFIISTLSFATKLVLIIGIGIIIGMNIV